jgi:hypothetical protein
VNAPADALVTLTTLTSFPSEFESQLLVNILVEHGIPAHTTGAFTSGFRAEAPGWVRVLVRSGDLEVATTVWEEARQSAGPPTEDSPAWPHLRR